VIGGKEETILYFTISIKQRRGVYIIRGKYILVLWKLLLRSDVGSTTGISILILFGAES